MWNALEKVFQRKGIASQLYLRKKLLTMKFSEDSLEKFFVMFDEIIRELKSVGAKLEETDVVCHLLLTLPKSFDNIVTALETLDPDKLTLEFVKGKLLDHEMKMINSSDPPVDSAAFLNRKQKKGQWHGETTNHGNKSSSFQFKCHNCGKKGHTRSRCWFPEPAYSSDHSEYIPDGSGDSSDNDSLDNNSLILNETNRENILVGMEVFPEVTVKSRKSVLKPHNSERNVAKRKKLW